MTRRILAPAAALLLAGVASLTVALTAQATPAPGPAAPGLLGPATDPWPMRVVLTALVRRMSLQERVGQLFVTYAYGASADTANPADNAHNRALYGVDTPAQLVAKYHLGGVIYFGWSGNVNNPAQVAHLSNGLQHAATSTGAGIPLLVSTDQEMGVVVRMTEPATQFPGNMPLGASRSTADACTSARITGQELHAVGINQNYAPVSDVNLNPLNPVIGVRSFGADPQLVASMAATQVGCFQQRDGVVATAKHFPGHGDTGTDSHTGIPVITHTREKWQQIDEPPFAAAVGAGIDAVMTAHIVVPALDPSGDPATLSRPIITGILRDQLHFDGVVTTDALDMQGVRDKYGDDRVPVLALQAGVDQLLKSPDGKLGLQYNAVLDAVRGGTLSRARIDQSVYRILRLKMARGVLADPYVDESRVAAVVGTPDHLAAARQVADDGITLLKNDRLKNDGGLLPLAKNSGRSVLVTGWGVTTTATIRNKVAQNGVTADALPTGLAPTPTQIAQATAAAARHDYTVVVTNRVWYDNAGSDYTSQQTLVRSLQATGRPVIVVAANVPYDIAYFPDVPAYLATYGYSAPTLDSLVRALFGDLNPHGRLPVIIPVAGQPETPLYPYGSGLSYP
jgi:beta-N-acetylhexosaminidase